MVLNNAVIPPTITDPTEWFKRAVLDYISMLHTYSAKATIWKGISFLSDRTHMGEDGAATIEVFKKQRKSVLFRDVSIIITKVITMH